METIISQYLLFLYIPIGVYIAHRICPKTNFLLRLVLLFPTMAAIATIVSVSQHNTHLLDLLRECSSLLIYSLLALLLTGKRILKNIDYEKSCERK